MPQQQPPAVESEWMASVDRAWLEMDVPGNPMVVAALIHLDHVDELARLQQELIARLHRHPRFRQRAEDQHTPARWLPAGDFEPMQHLRIRTLPGHAPQDELRRAIAEELVQPLDRARPLWHLTLFPRPHHKLTILFRAHHAMGDGVGFMQLLLDLHDQSAARAPLPRAAARASGTKPGPLAPLILRLSALDAALQRGSEKWRWARKHPDEAMQKLREGAIGGAAVARVLRLKPKTPPPLRGQLSGEREVAWIDGIAVAPLKAAAHAHGVKLNDLLLAALAGAFRDSLHTALDAREAMRVSIPVNLRQAGDSVLGNHFGLVLFELPIGIAERQARLHHVADGMARLKASAEARAILGSLALAGTLPAAVERRLVQWIAGKSCAVVSNLHGPDQPLEIAGAKISGLLFWPPQTAGIGLGVSLLSYAGQLSVGISADRATLPQPQRLLDAMRAELAAFATSADPTPAAAPRRRARRRS